MTTARFQGTVVQKGSTTPLAGVTVEAYDLSEKISGVVAKAVTDEDGAFLLDLGEVFVERAFGEAAPTLFFRVRSGTDVIATTQKSLLWSARSTQRGRIEVDPSAPRFTAPVATSKYLVEGRVAKAASGPVAGATVTLYRRTLTASGVSDASIATTTTGSDGRYKIVATLTADRPSFRLVASLAATAFASAVIDGVSLHEIVDLSDDEGVVGRSAFERLRRTVEPHALVGGTTEIDWSEDQIDFVSGASREPRRLVQQYADAKRLFDLTDKASRETYFGLLAKGLPTTPGRFFARGRSSFRAALEQAIADGDVQRGLDIEAELNDLEDAAVDQLMLTTHPDIVPIGALVTLTSGTDLSESVRRQFVRLVVRNDGVRDATWAAVAADGTTGAHVDELRLRVGLGQVSAEHRPMLTALRALPGLTEEKNVATRERGDIRAMVDTIAPHYPPDTEGTNETEKRDAYAKEVSDRIEKKFRTEFHKKSFGSATNEETFFTDNPTFDFVKTRVATYLAENETALYNIPAPDRPAVVARLKEEERLFHFTNYSHEVVALRAAGIKSAFQVQRHGRARFKTAMNASGLSDAALDAIYDQAVHRTAVGQVALAKYSFETSAEALSPAVTVLPKGIMHGIATPSKLADWPSLFGTLDACRCSPCMSVLSPAAYLVDLLQFLRRVDATGADDGHDRFIERRPDVRYILLDCPSSLTPMPMIDLAIEIMEVRVALIVEHGAGSVELPEDWPTKTIATRGDAEELAAMPDPVYNQGSNPAAFLRNRAYTHLNARIYPFDAPYTLWSDEVATYLAALGVPRHELCRILAPSTTASGEVSAAELETMWRLGLSRGAYQIINGESPRAPYELWGLPAPLAYPGALAPVPSFLRRSGLSYDELRELVATSWADPEFENVAITGTSCRLEDLEIEGLDPGNLLYLHRLLRLKLRTKLTITEIDKARASILSTIDDASLRKFALAYALHESLDVPWATALTWWGLIDTRSTWAPSTFHRLFLDKSARNPNDDEFERLVTNPAGEGIELQDVIPGLLIGTRLREQDLRLLFPVDDATAVLPVSTIESLAVPAVLDSRQNLTLANVSRLVRHATFARALRIPLAEMLLLRVMAGAKPFVSDADHGGPADTRAFVELIERVRSGPLSVADIDYLLRDRPYPGLRPDDTKPWIEEIDAALARIHAVAITVEDPTGERTRALLEELFGEESAAVDEVFNAIEQRDPPQLATWEASIRSHLSRYLENVDAAVLVLFGDSVATPPIPGEPSRERFAYVARRLERYVAARAFVRTWAAQTFAIPVEVATFFLESRLTWLPHGTLLPISAIRALLPGNNVLAPPAPVDADPARPAALVRSAQDATKVDQILRRLHKAALLVNRLHLDVAQVQFLFRSVLPGELQPRLNLNALRTTSATAFDAMPTTAFASLLDIVDLAALGNRFPGGPSKLETLLRAFTVGTIPVTPELVVPYPFPDPGDPPQLPGPPPSKEDALKALAEAAGWQPEDVALLATRFGVTTIERLCDIDILIRIERAMNALATLGARATAAIDWVTWTSSGPGELEVPPRVWSEERNARAAIHHLRARYADDAAWSAVAKPLRNAIRERQRDALVATLLDYLNMSKPADLYAHLLIDVEVTAAPMTSRIVQASASIQQYIQRVLLQLESGVAVDEATAAAWKWMKSYRVWEANRKVFLYPENYLVPELRDDKTPLFQELETYLLQGPVTHERAEEAYLRYLGGLEEVANLRPVAICKDELDTVHVVGASEEPRRYYYRSRRKERWSPWERVDLDIEGNHLALAAQRGHVYLVWLHVDEVAHRKQQQGQGQPSLRENRLRVSCSALKNGTWSRKTTTGYWDLHARLPSRYFRLTVNVTSEGFLAVTALAEEAARHAIAATWYVDPLRGSSSRVIEQIFDYAQGDRYNDSDFAITLPDCVDFLPNMYTFARVGDGAMVPTGQADAWLGLYAGGLALFVEAGLYVRAFLPSAGRRYSLTPEARSIDPTQLFVAFSDSSRSFLIEPGDTVGFDRCERKGELDLAKTTPLRCSLMVHPFAGRFRDAVNLLGLDGLLDWNSQSPVLQTATSELAPTYNPNPDVFKLEMFPREEVDFRTSATFGVYNWELFFHIPMMMATRLATARRHEEAMQWFHYVFNPTDGSLASSPARYWKVKPFFELKDFDDIAEELQDLAEGAYSGYLSLEELLDFGADDTEGSRAIGAQIDEWIADPFDPFAIARLRHLAYMKWVVQAYIQNLLDWGDQLFAQDTLESVNEATQLYIHALNLLGPRPVTVSPPVASARRTYLDLEPDLDDMGNALVGSETSGGYKMAKPLNLQVGRVDENLLAVASVWRRLYFCIPPNEKLLGMWDLVEDRLFKIRHSLNIEGIARTLPLFAPPIDPALLVAATAAGLDLTAVVADLNAAAPYYRFNVLLAKAGEFASAVVALGQSLLSALEKRDAEELALLRQTHEIAIHQATLTVRREQIKESQASLDALRQSKAPVQARLDFYAATKEVYDDEERALKTATRGHAKIDSAGDFNLAAKAATAVPDLVAGSAGLGPAAWAQYGGTLLSAALGMLALQAEKAGSRLIAESGNLSTRAGYRRRFEDYKREEAALKEELVSIDKQIVAAEIRLAIAEHELAVVEKQIEQSREVNDVLKSKFTNKQLYDWMVSQISAVYFQAYQLAYDMARKAERAFQLERGDDSQRFIRFGAWDAVHQGLLAGERLAQDLRSLDAAYIAQNRREYEVTKNLSLAQHDPVALLWLREGGTANFTITEADYDRDHPTHYLRRLKSVAVSIPCVTGPVQGVAGQLTLFRGETRPTATAADAEVRESFGVLQSIVTSSGQNDAGLFETNLRDERLLPFEGVGAHASPALQAQWRYSVSPGADFDRRSIDDLVLHVRYTAREGRLGASPNIASRWTVVRLHVDAPDAWGALVDGDEEEVAFVLKARDFPTPASVGAPPTWSIRAIRLATTRVGDIKPAVFGLADTLELEFLKVWDEEQEPPVLVPAGPVPIGDLDLWTVDSAALAGATIAAASDAWKLSYSGSDLALRHGELKEAWLLIEYGVNPEPG